MQQNDAKDQQMASEIMLALMNFSPDHFSSLASTSKINEPKPLALNQALVEQVKQVKAERNTIAQQKKDHVR